MMPKGSHKMIRSITIHYYRGYIHGISFFDKKGALLCEIGDTWSWLKMETVKLAENEVIVGVVAKLYPDF
jgi:hypothetical protein